jgi:uncharacterized protein
MKDMFNEFMRELAERQRRAERGENPDAGPDHPGDPDDDDAPGGGPHQEAGVPDDSRSRDEAHGGDDLKGPDRAASDDDRSDERTDDESPDDESPDGDRTDDERPGPEPVPFGRPRGGERAAGGERGSTRGTRARGGPGGPGGPNDGAPPRRRGFGSFGPQVLLVVVGIILLAAVLLVGSGVDLATNAIWFQSVGFDSVFWTRLTGQAGLFLLGLLGTLVFLGLNLWLAGRLAPPPGTGGDRLRAWATRAVETARGSADTFGARDAFGMRRPPFGPGGGGAPGGQPARPVGPSISFDDLPDLTPFATVVLAVIAVLAALGAGGALSGNWETVVLWIHRVPYAPTGAPVVDPVFQRDISFYLFDLGFLRLVQGVVSNLFLLALGLAGARYLVAVLRGGGFPMPVRVHLAILGGVFLLTVAAGYQLDKLALVYGDHGFVAGVSYTDQAARFFAFDALTIVAGVVGVLVVFAAFTRWLWPAGVGVAVWLGLSVLLGGLYPEVIQKFTVEPNQQTQEQAYIGNNIAMTRLAYGIADWKGQRYDGSAPLTAEAVAEDSATFQNARLWDYRPLKTALEQIQTVRQYYQFVDVDTDRYTIGGTTRQVMLSARELAPDRNPQATSWVNQKIVFTHGFGLTMVPVNEVGAQGLPQLIIKDLPPASTAGAPTVSQPRIYFGERANDWVVVGARQLEFDYPIGNTDTSGAAAPTSQQAETRWTGTTGIKLNSLLTKLLFAARFRDLNLLISDQVTAESQLLMNRSLGERLNLIAPFLAYDGDPYVVLTDQGRLVYIQDAYTTSDAFPNAQPFDGAQLPSGGLVDRSFNYVRNSVKIVMDSYDGSMTFYIADPSDPLIRAWSGVFPTLFQPLETMPAELQAHLRVPEQMFDVQTSVYARYHVTDPIVFYQGNDVWKVPQQAQSSNQSTGQLPMEAYYVYMRMPGQADPEFLLLQPMVPAARPNMIAWIAARNDGANRGQVQVYDFPDNSSIFGPAQIESRIDADPTISGQITLWNQSGSQVVRGNLIVIPVQNSIIYLEPIYLQSTGSAIPSFTKVVLASPTKVVWGDTLAQALTALLAGGSVTPGPSPSPGASPGASPTPQPTAAPGLPSDVAGLVKYANDHYDAAQAALRAGDFATYGVEMQKVKDALGQLSLVTATPAPSLPSPAPSPTPSTAP